MVGLLINEQLEWEDFQRLTKRRWEREQGRREATEDMSEDLSEGEKGDTVGELLQSETPRKKIQRNISDLQLWSDDNKGKKLYIVLIRYFFVRREDVLLTVKALYEIKSFYFFLQYFIMGQCNETKILFISVFYAFEMHGSSDYIPRR